MAFFLRGAMMLSMNFRTSKQNFYRKLFVMGVSLSRGIAIDLILNELC